MRFLMRRLGPWAWPFMLLRAALAVRRHFRQVAPEDRALVQELLKKSSGRPAGLSPDERQDLFRAARRLRPGKLLRDIFTDVIRPGRRARRAER